jgi:hypothetical protein
MGRLVNMVRLVAVVLQWREPLRTLFGVDPPVGKAARVFMVPVVVAVAPVVVSKFWIAMHNRLVSTIWVEAAVEVALVDVVERAEPPGAPVAGPSESLWSLIT